MQIEATTTVVTEKRKKKKRRRPPRDVAPTVVKLVEGALLAAHQDKSPNASVYHSTGLRHWSAAAVATFLIGGMLIGSRTERLGSSLFLVTTPLAPPPIVPPLPLSPPLSPPPLPLLPPPPLWPSPLLSEPPSPLRPAPLPPPVAPPQPPPLPPPSLHSRAAIVARINERFGRKPYNAGWNKAGTLADAGLLVHIFDGWESRQNPGQEQYTAQVNISTSLIYADQRPACCPQYAIPVYSPWKTKKQGIIFRPGPTTQIVCGSAADTSIGECQPWCPSVPFAERDSGDWKATNKPGGCQGSWRPEDFGVFLYRVNTFQREVQAIFRRGIEYNEILVDGAHWTAHLPHTIEAFFGTEGHMDLARIVHARFLRAFQLDTEQVPLLTFREHQWEQPFS